MNINIMIYSDFNILKDIFYNKINNNDKYKDINNLIKNKYIELYVINSIDELKEKYNNISFNICLTEPKKINEILKYCSNIQWIQSTYAGVDSFFNQKNDNYNGILTKIGKGFGPQMKEYVLNCILSYYLKNDKLYENQKLKIFDSNIYSNNKIQLNMLKIGILGASDIGNNICDMANYFKFKKIIQLGRTAKNNLLNYKNYEYTLDLNYLLSNSDVIVNCLPSTHLTKGLLNKINLKLCYGNKPLFINIGRGNIITEDDLLFSINNNYLNFAILDVFENEPLDNNNKLWNNERIKITPHISGLSNIDIILNIFLKNLKLFINKKQLKYIVNLKNKY